MAEVAQAVAAVSAAGYINQAIYDNMAVRLIASATGIDLINRTNTPLTFVDGSIADRVPTFLILQWTSGGISPSCDVELKTSANKILIEAFTVKSLNSTYDKKIVTAFSLGDAYLSSSPADDIGLNVVNESSTNCVINAYLYGIKFP